MQDYNMTPNQVFEIAQRRAEHEEQMHELMLNVSTIEINGLLDQPKGWN